MKFTKLTLVALLLALLVCAFVACGGNPVETDAGNETAGDTQTNAPETDAEPATDGEGEHVHTVVEKIDEPTCQQRGYKREICSTCDEQLSVKPIDMVEHTSEKPATCTEGSFCKFCGTVMETAKGHNVTTITETKAATNTEAGYEKGICADCGEEITTVIPAGITDNFNNFPTGGVSNDILGANSAFAPDFTVTVNKGDSFEIAEEGNNKFIKKLGPDGQIYYAGEALNSDKVEITFDVRVDSEISGIKGLLSIWGDKEMRVLNFMADGKIGFGINTGGILNFADYEIGKWVNIKVALNTETFDYEIYVNGELMLATASDPDNAGMHLVYIKENGEMVHKNGEENKPAGFNNATLHNGGDRSPFVLNGDSVKKIEFFHWTADFACSLDNVTVSMIND